jgi:hypothetical protein
VRVSEREESEGVLKEEGRSVLTVQGTREEDGERGEEFDRWHSYVAPFDIPSSLAIFWAERTVPIPPLTVPQRPNTDTTTPPNGRHIEVFIVLTFSGLPRFPFCALVLLLPRCHLSSTSLLSVFSPPVRLLVKLCSF